jgi:hypothetical protein
MALRFLSDHCVSNYTVQTLREAQHEVFRLRDRDLPSGELIDNPKSTHLHICRTAQTHFRTDQDKDRIFGHYDIQIA